ncbi:hypothetical protein M409DRAFT_63568 [Zasmidium cellare ATCC 36951]|uniref:SET domain-containing protein n=1 Tax=Zasmidium cellare ATCC 36951 TaxID=1080233 RepID=A0A6A6D0M4_ZASCE|nr:uncharacterized protein M409DRAFT_63568 [Zasmidium cellare ATCC 36951]KAF2171196.1 hypothetical protein M409DRAFT_63568 [Zasmidium cellare ATCC 36951]
MLIQTGKAEGWLHLDVDSVRTWATTSGIGFSNASPKAIPERGIGLLTDRSLSTRERGNPWEVLTVTEDLVLSVEAVKKHALFDKDFREVFDSLGEFGKTPRGGILSFLLFQASLSCPHLHERFGVHFPFTDYVKTLPCELLPTFWTPAELQLLVGTTLAPAVSSKLKSLRREYDLLCEKVAYTRWFQIVESLLDFDDWLQVDAMFRSRALDFYGSCMIPGMDLASHGAGERTNAFYDRADGRYFLWLLEDKELQEGEEITITYGDEKGACEMLFSYGFLEEQMEKAETLFLSLSIPEDDPRRAAKMKIAQSAPGFKIIDASEQEQRTPQDDGQSSAKEIDETGAVDENSGEIDWKGDFVWLLCMTEEDGLRFQIARTVDGEEELQATFHDQELKGGAADLRRLLSQTPLWPVYRLRAVVILQQRVFEQMQVLYQSQEDVEGTPHGDGADVRDAPYQQAMKLRRLEFDLLEKAYEDFERQKVDLAESPVVQQYLADMNDEQQPEEDFS